MELQIIMWSLFMCDMHKLAGYNTSNNCTHLSPEKSMDHSQNVNCHSNINCNSEWVEADIFGRIVVVIKFFQPK